MNRVFITGIGAVSPAGWTASDLDAALRRNVPCPTRPLDRPGWTRPLFYRPVPPPSVRPTFLAHPRLRRTSPISQFAMGAAVEALGPWPPPGIARPRLGIVLGVHAACIRYSERFYVEVLQNPATASPMLFPETVINAPASHLATCLGGAPLTYSLVGDETVFVEALALGATWLACDQVDRVLVVGAEESDWLVADALHQTADDLVGSEGAGALCLAAQPLSGNAVELDRITDTWSYAGAARRTEAVTAMRRDLSVGSSKDLLCDSQNGVAFLDRPEAEAWRDWPGARLSPRRILGQGLGAATAWQFVAACRWLQERPGCAAHLSVVGSNAAAVGSRLTSLS